MSTPSRKRACAAALSALLLSALPAPAAEQAFKLIVNPSVQGAQMKRQDVAAIFLVQTIRWGGGEAIVPVDQSAQSPVRAAFSLGVLGQPVVAVQAYWMQRISGRRGWPPVVKASDAEVMAHVAGTPGAIGYVSSSASLDPGVREVRLD